MKTGIFYGSTTGNTENAAELIGEFNLKSPFARRGRGAPFFQPVRHRNKAEYLRLQYKEGIRPVARSD